jgi:hypothetical protein
MKPSILVRPYAPGLWAIDAQSDLAGRDLFHQQRSTSDMTAIRDALTRAGINTAGAELHARTAEALKFHRGDVDMAARKLATMLVKRRNLFDALVLDHVRRVAADPTVAAAIAADMPKDVRVKKHDRHRRRTEAERAAALRVAGSESEIVGSVFERRINGRFIGDLAVRELNAMVMHNAFDAAGFLKLGTDSVANAILLHSVQDFVAQTYAQADGATLVRNVIPAATLQALIDDAESEAPRFVEKRMRDYARAVAENRREAIA